VRAEDLVTHFELRDGGADRRHGSGEVVADDLGLHLAARGHPAHENAAQASVRTGPQG
jgi:hypothetical protein